MAPTSKTTNAAKHASSPEAEPPAKRSRQHSKKEDSSGKTEQHIKEEESGDNDTHIKSEQSSDTEQPGEPSSKSSTTLRRSARIRGSPEIKAEENTNNEADHPPHIKAEEETESSPSAKKSATRGKRRGSVKSGEQQAENGGPRVIEEGRAFFFYRPKIDVDTPSDVGDIQRLYMLLSPDGAVGRPATEDKDKVNQSDQPSKPHAGTPLHRLLIIPQKSLPSPGKGRGSRVWAFMAEVSADVETLDKKLEQYTYSTKTRGERTQESARLVGEARYGIILDYDHSHFVYELEVPPQPGEVQEAFNILKQGQFLIQVKNPEIQTPATERGRARYATLGESAAKLPKHLQEKFRGVRKEWVRHTALDTTEFLDIQHVEVVLFAVHKSAKEEFAEAVKVLEAEVKEEEEKEIDDKKPEAHTYKELGLDEDKIPDAVKEFK
ncbi:hypothetical protein BG011_001320 [Mortierella polycephala]|uniref:Uncharacterized protein n=1 Tax=Mortierella polycephala TaxID=41804 RepID=A0A9P6TU60_9FUNG|nr:hypothetical protein BG011_001320 [Mortierella polycephala]